VFELQNNVMLMISVVLFVVKGFALVDCLMRSESRIAAAGNLTKPGWLVILVLAFAVHPLFSSPLALLNLAGTVAALVYLAQVRSAS